MSSLVGREAGYACGLPSNPQGSSPICVRKDVRGRRPRAILDEPGAEMGAEPKLRARVPDTSGSKTYVQSRVPAVDDVVVDTAVSAASVIVPVPVWEVRL